MKKILKVLLLVLCLAMFASLISGCGLSAAITKGSPKDFTKAGMTITLTTKFSEQELVNQTACYSSQTIVVTALKEENSLFEKANVQVKNLSEYANLVIETNKISSTVKESDGATYFIYEAEANGKTFKYYARVFKAEDAYWLVQFGCEKDNFDGLELEFVDYSDTVVFDKTTTSAT